MGRKRADCWSEYGEIQEGGSFKARRVKCSHCGHELTAHANRMKEHLRQCSSYRDALTKGQARQVDLSTVRYETRLGNDIQPEYSLPQIDTYRTHSCLRMGIVGGRPGSFIGPVHITAATMDRRAKLVCGCFSSDIVKSRQAGTQYGLPRNRVYKSFDAMIDKELRLPEAERMNFVAITTPNDLHFQQAMRAVQNGFHVMCEKPLCITEEEALQLQQEVRAKGVIFGVAHAYTAYPMVRQAREMVMNGHLGQILAVRVKYLQSSGMGERDRRVWANQAQRVGNSYCFGDIGIHAYNLMRYITGLHPLRLSACLNRIFGNRTLDDYGTCTIQLKGGGMCSITASKISQGRMNDLSIEIDGSMGSLEWHQENPSELVHRHVGLPKQIFSSNSGGFCDADYVRRAARLPQGHPEGFIEAFANLYNSFFNDIEAHDHDSLLFFFNSLYPTIYDGVDGMSFLYRCLESSQRDGCWIDFTSTLEAQPLFDTTSVPAIPSYEPLSVHSVPVPVPVSTDDAVSVNGNNKHTIVPN
ncbi:hypothetical protein WA158_004065 [Blastocystis sp. Blastoise]